MGRPSAGHGFPMAERLHANLSAQKPLSGRQQRVLAYIEKVQSEGVARITQHELGAAIDCGPGVARRVLHSLQRRGLVGITVIRATFVTLRRAP